MKSRLLIPIIGASVFALSLAPAQAQTQSWRSLRQNFPTSGPLSWGGQTQNVRSVRVELDEDGDARLKFDVQDRDWNWGWREGDWINWNQNLELDGVWLRDERGVTIDLRRGLGGQTIIGTAHIALEDGGFRPRLSDMTISGRVVRRPWDTIGLNGRFDFDGWNGGWGNTNRISELATIKRGSGQFSDGTYGYGLTRANVDLKRDGTATISLNGDREWTFEGRWRQVSADRIVLRLDTFAARDDQRTNNVRRDEPDSLGSGEIRLDGTRFVSLRLSGRRSDRDFTVYFEPQVLTNDGGWNGGNGGWDGNDGWNRGRGGIGGRGWFGDLDRGGRNNPKGGNGQGPKPTGQRPIPLPGQKDWIGSIPKGALPAPPAEPTSKPRKDEQPAPPTEERPRRPRPDRDRPQLPGATPVQTPDPAPPTPERPRDDPNRPSPPQTVPNPDPAPRPRQERPRDRDQEPRQDRPRDRDQEPRQDRPRDHDEEPRQERPRRSEPVKEEPKSQPAPPPAPDRQKSPDPAPAKEKEKERSDDKKDNDKGEERERQGRRPRGGKPR